MNALQFTILYVTNPASSAKFYQRILNVSPVELSPTFAMLALPSACRLGLWARSGVEPAVAAGSSQAEIVLAAASRSEVDDCFSQWHQWGIEILQVPTEMDFGYTFTACDPDGHRIRVYVFEQ